MPSPATTLMSSIVGGNPSMPPAPPSASPAREKPAFIHLGIVCFTRLSTIILVSSSGDAAPPPGSLTLNPSPPPPPTAPERLHPLLSPRASPLLQRGARWCSSRARRRRSCGSASSTTTSSEGGLQHFFRRVLLNLRVGDAGEGMFEPDGGGLRPKGRLVSPLPGHRHHPGLHPPRGHLPSRTACCT